METFNTYTRGAKDARSKMKPLGLWTYAMVLVAFLMFAGSSAYAQNPCNATRWNSGDGWRYNASTQKWDAVKVTGSNTLPLGVVACASAASTQSGLEAFKTVYNGNFALQQRTACFNQETSQRDPNLTINSPTAGTTEIVWFNFDIRPLAGTYQFQIVTNQAMGWMLYYSNESQPMGGNTSDGKYPLVGSSTNSQNLSGNCSDLTYADCGKSGNGWSTITVPSFNEPTNYYLAIFPLDGGKINSSANLVYKARYGCGGATCTIEKVGEDDLTCNSNSTYTVCSDFQGSAGRWRLQDNALNKASSYTITTFDANNQQVGSTLTSSNLSTSPLFLTLGTVDNGAVYATICATYASGEPYNIQLLPDAAYSPSNNYVTCTDGLGFSGSGISPPVVSAGSDFAITCTENINGKQIGEASAVGYTYSWSPSNGLSAANVSNPTANPSETTTYTVTKTHTASGCSDTDEVTVTVNKPDVVAAAGSDFAITCTENINGKQIGEASAVGYTYSWSPSNGLSAANVSNPTANPSETTTYTVTKTHTASGCSDTDEVTVTVNKTKPLASAIGGALDCTTNQLQLSGAGSSTGNNFSYLWTTTDGNIVSDATTLSPTVNMVGTYLLTVTNTSNGCSETAQAIVTPAVNCGAFTGCTPGYWKQSQHFGNWGCGYVPVASGKGKSAIKATTYADAFGLTDQLLKNQKINHKITMLEALDLGGGGFARLLRHSTAALLSSCNTETGGTTNYEYTRDQIISMVQGAFANPSTVNSVSDLLEAANERDCPLARAELTSTSTTSLQGLDLAERNQLRAYPTPFTDKAVIEFTVAQDENFSMRLYDMRGALVRELRTGEAKAGLVNTVEVDGKGLPEGLYIARMVSDSGTKTVKLLKKE